MNVAVKQRSQLMRLQNVLSQFVKSSRKTLLVKGKWGVGKTFAVRKFLFSGDCPVKTFSYVSLSGVATVSDERSLAISGLEREDGQTAWEKYSSKIADFAKAATKLIPLGAAGGVADVGIDALGGFFANRVIKGAVVVLDDIERKGESLSLGAIFGTISRLTEIREAKVIVIMNEEELVNADLTAAKTLSHQREKIFDQEFEFQPSVDEALSIIRLNETAEYVEPTARSLVIKEYVEPTARKLKINNLRVLQKMVWTVEELADHLMNVDAAIKSRVVSQVAVIAAIRFRAKVLLKPEHLVNSSHFAMLESFHRKSENPFRGELEALEYTSLPVDHLLLEFLNSGSFDQEKFDSILPNLAALHAEEDFQKQEDAISAFIWGKFALLEPLELDRIEQLLDGDSVGRISPNSFDFYQEILEVNERTVGRARRELRWAQKVPIDVPFSWASIEQSLKTEEAKRALRQRLDAAQDPDAPRTFRETLDRDGSHLSLPFLRSTEAGDAEALWQILRSISNPRLVGKVTILLREAQRPEMRSAEASPYLSRFSEALLSALQKLSDENAMNKIRVDSIRSKAKLDL